MTSVVVDVCAPGGWLAALEQAGEGVRKWGVWLDDQCRHRETVWRDGAAARATLCDCAELIDFGAAFIDALERQVGANAVRQRLCNARLELEDAWFTVSRVGGARVFGQMGMSAPATVVAAGFSHARERFMVAARDAGDALAVSADLRGDVQRAAAVVGTVLAEVAKVVLAAEPVVEPQCLSAELASLTQSSELLAQAVVVLMKTSTLSRAQLSSLMDLPEPDDATLVGELQRCLSETRHALAVAANGAWSYPGAMRGAGSAEMTGLLSAGVRAMALVLDTMVEADESGRLSKRSAFEVHRVASALRDLGITLSLGAKTRAMGSSRHVSGAAMTLSASTQLDGFSAVYQLARSMANGAVRAWGAAVARATAQTYASVVVEMVSVLDQAAKVSEFVAMAGNGGLAVDAEVQLATVKSRLVKAASQLRLQVGAMAADPPRVERRRRRWWAWW